MTKEAIELARGVPQWGIKAIGIGGPGGAVRSGHFGGVLAVAMRSNAGKTGHMRAFLRQIAMPTVCEFAGHL